jgi:hypothetical protein
VWTVWSCDEVVQHSPGPGLGIAVLVLRPMMLSVVYWLLPLQMSEVYPAYNPKPYPGTLELPVIAVAYSGGEGGGGLGPFCKGVVSVAWACGPGRGGAAGGLEVEIGGCATVHDAQTVPVAGHTPSRHGCMALAWCCHVHWTGYSTARGASVLDFATHVGTENRKCHVWEGC